MSRKTVEFRRKVDQITGSDYNRRCRMEGKMKGGVKRKIGAEMKEEVSKIIPASLRTYARITLGIN